MHSGTGDQIIPLSQQATQQHTQVLASTSLMEAWIVTQLSHEKGEICNGCGMDPDAEHGKQVKLLMTFTDNSSKVNTAQFKCK